MFNADDTTATLPHASHSSTQARPITRIEFVEIYELLQEAWLPDTKADPTTHVITLRLPCRLSPVSVISWAESLDQQLYWATAAICYFSFFWIRQTPHTFRIHLPGTAELGQHHVQLCFSATMNKVHLSFTHVDICITVQQCHLSCCGDFRIHSHKMVTMHSGALS